MKKPMTKWEKLAVQMLGLADVDDIPDSLRTRLERLEYLICRTGRKLVSSQAVALLIEDWEYHNPSGVLQLPVRIRV